MLIEVISHSLANVLEVLNEFFFLFFFFFFHFCIVSFFLSSFFPHVHVSVPACLWENDFMSELLSAALKIGRNVEQILTQAIQKL